MVSALAKLVVECENLGWRGISKVLWSDLASSDQFDYLLESEPANLEGLLLAHVRRRNDGSGHGLPGGYDRRAEQAMLLAIIDKLDPLIPRIDARTEALHIGGAGQNGLALSLIKPLGGQLYIVRNIKSTKAGICVVKVQVQSNLGEREELSFESPDVLASAPQYRRATIDYTDTEIGGWEPLANLPERLTEAFSGRDEEMKKLADWFDDVESKTCLVFGDGGMGKTTLVVEFLHRVFDRKVNTTWRPDLIFFYTAKRTRWGINGLEIIDPSTVGASDIALSLAKAMEGTVGREWYSLDSAGAIGRLETLLASYGLNRGQILVVVDNAETLAQSDEDVVALSKTMRETRRRIGRVIVTSRRREHIEAEMLELPQLSEEECESLLRKRARTLTIKHIEQAGGATLRSYSKRLGRKPLVLEVFVQSLCESGASLEKAFNRVQQMQNQDLGEFLYSDAWQRIGEPLRRMLLLMSRVGEVHDEILMKLCAAECDVSVLEAQRAIDESRGIASISRISGAIQVAFTPEFMRFCAGQAIKSGVRELVTSDMVDKVGRRYRHFQASASKQVTDRTGTAFRHPLARAAYRSAMDGADGDAEAWYELAVGADSANAALHDRYAYFLLARGRLPIALDRACRAVQLEPAVSEFWFTKGIVESKSNLAEEALKSLAEAQRLGKPSHLCALQMAYAYSKRSPPDLANARAALSMASHVPMDDKFRQKHLAEISKLKRRLDSYWAE